jgi:chaperonin GroEL (HSP60 family)
MTASRRVFAPVYNHLKGTEAWRQNLNLTAMASEKIRSCLGPNGAYKMVVYNRGPEKVVRITKDVVKVLEELSIQYPALKVITEAAKMQREEIGDGVTAFTIFTSALLREANKLVSKKVHPNIVLEGYLKAKQKAIACIDQLSKNLDELEKNELLESVDCGRGLLTNELRRMLEEAAEIVTTNKKIEKDKIHVIKKPGAATTETTLVKGIVIKKEKCHKNMPDHVEKPRIAVISGRFGSNRVEVKMRGTGPFNMKFEINTPENLNGCLEADKNTKTSAVETLSRYGVNVLFSQQPIDQCVKSKLVEQGILAFEGVNQDDCIKISRATNANVICNPSDLTKNDIGKAERLETDKIGLEKTVTLTGCRGATFLLRGTTRQALEELELLVHNSTLALNLIQNYGRVVPGGGAVEMNIAKELTAFSKKFSGREQLAIAAFGDALLDIPRCLAYNNGLDSESVIAELRSLHARGFSACGVSSNGCSENVCVEIAVTKRAMINRAYEVVCLMLRVNEQLVHKEIPRVHKQQ